MKIIIRTYRFEPAKGNSGFRFLKEKKCGNLAEALREWMNAMLSFEVDRIYIEVDKTA